MENQDITNQVSTQENQNEIVRNYVPIWDCIPKAIKWSINHRNQLIENKNLESHESKLMLCGINMSIVVNSAMLVEGFCDSYLKQYVSIQSSFSKANSDIDKVIFEKIFSHISSVGWDKYNRLFKDLTGSSISDLLVRIPNNAEEGDVAPQDWIDKLLKNDIKLLFSFRNLLVHGQSIGMDFTFEDENILSTIKYHNKFDSILSDLKGRNIHNKNTCPDTLFVERFLTTEGADYFFERAKEFVYRMSELLETTWGMQTKGHLNYIFSDVRMDEKCT